MKNIPSTIEAFYIENALREPMLDEIMHVMNGNNFGWYMFSDVNFNEDSSDITKYGFKHNFIYENQDTSSYAPLVVPVAMKAAEQTGSQLNNIYSCYAVLTMNCGKEHDGFPHIDAHQHPETKEVKRYSAVYYLEDCDGDTVFYDESGKEIIYRVTPKKNSMIVFRTNTYHSGMLPMIFPTRRIINLNIGVDW